MNQAKSEFAWFGTFQGVAKQFFAWFGRNTATRWDGKPPPFI